MKRKRIIALTVFLLAFPFLGSAQQWEIDIEKPGGVGILMGVNLPDGDILAVGECSRDGGSNTPYMLRIGNDGTYQEFEYEGMPGEDVMISSLIALDDGNYFAAGVGSMTSAADGDGEFIKTILFSDDLEIISQQNIDMGDSTLIYDFVTKLFIDDDGTIVLSGECHYLPNNRRPYFYRFDNDGNVISCRYGFDDDKARNYVCYQIFKDPSDGNLAIVARGLLGRAYIFHYDYDFNFVSGVSLDYEDEVFSTTLFFDYPYSDALLSEDRMLMLGGTWITKEERPQYNLAFAEVGFDGTVYRADTICHTQNKTSPADARCMARVCDTTIYGAFRYYYNYFPQYPGVCLFDTDMEILGVRRFEDDSHKEYGPYFILPSSDGGCIVSMLGSDMNGELNVKIAKFSREDFNPIPCSVKEIPQEKLQGIVFPNPTHGELNIDISNIPGGIENRVSITDMHGVVRMSRIIRGNGNLLTIDASALEAGTYVYSVFNSKKELLKGKFVKE